VGRERLQNYCCAYDTGPGLRRLRTEAVKPGRTVRPGFSLPASGGGLVSGHNNLGKLARKLGQMIEFHFERADALRQ